MPKLATKTISVLSGGRGHHFTLQVNYKTGYGFWVALPKQLSEAIEAADPKQLEKYGLKERNITRSKYSSDVTWTWAGQTEEKLFESIEPAIRYLLDLNQKKEQVILIMLNTSKPYGRERREVEDGNYPEIKLSFEMKVATKVSSGKDFVYFGTDGSGSREKLNYNWHRRDDDVVCLPFKEETLEYLAGLYGALTKLRDQLEKNFDSEAAVVSLISGKQQPFLLTEKS